MSQAFSRPILSSAPPAVILLSRLKALTASLPSSTSIQNSLDMLIDLLLDMLSWVGGSLGNMEIVKVFEKRPLAAVLPVLFVVNILSVVYVAFAHCALPAAGISLVSRESVIFHILTALSLVSYYRAVVTDPGCIPDTCEWREDNSDSLKSLIRERKKSNGSLRFCNKEKKYKPDRAHFCSPMGRNVLKLDHYCPWLANAVGFRNHKYFFLFLLYGTIACDLASFGIGRVLYTAHVGTTILQPAHLFFLSQGLGLSGILSTILTPFTFFHIWLISGNTTTIEFCEKRRGGWVSDYHLGFFENWQSVLGSNPFYCLIPVDTLNGDGLSFPRKEISDESFLPELEEGENEQLLAALERRAKKCTPVVDPRDACVQWWGTVLDNCKAISDFGEGALMGFGRLWGG